MFCLGVLTCIVMLQGIEQGHNYTCFVLVSNISLRICGFVCFCFVLVWFGVFLGGGGGWVGFFFFFFFFFLSLHFYICIVQRI